MSVKVATEDTPYVWVSGGTKRRQDIVPVNAKALAFRPGYTPATSPRSISSQRPIRSGPVIYTQRVSKRRNKGIKARKFDSTIRKRQRLPFYADITAAIYRGMTN